MGGNKLKRKKILHVTQPTTEGVGLAVKFICKYADKYRFELHVSCPNNKEFINPLKSYGATIHVIDYVREINPIQDTKTAIQLYKLIKDLKVDILSLHSSKAGALGRMVGYIAGVQTIVYTPNAFAYFNNKSVKGKFFFFIEKLLSHVTDYVIAVSGSEFKRALDDGVVPAKKLRLVENGIDIDRFNIEVDRQAKRESLSIPEKSPIIGMVGRLGYQKAPEVFVQSAIHLLDTGKNYYFYIAGDGPQMEELSEMVKEAGYEQQILLLGNRSDVPELLHITDVFVLPSRYEGLPFTLLEAMAVGLPIIATDAVGNRDVIHDNETGLLIPIDDDQAIYNAVERLINDQSLANRLGETASKYVREHHSVEAMVKEVEKVYLEKQSSATISS